VMKTPVVAPATNSLPPPRTTASGTTGSRSENPPKASSTSAKAARIPGVLVSCVSAPDEESRGLTPASQRALGGADSADAGVRLDGRTQRAGDRLVLGLGDVVRVPSVVDDDVQRDASSEERRAGEGGTH